MKKLILFLLLSISLYGQKFEFLVPKNNAIVRPSQRVEINWLNQYTSSTLLSWYNFSTQTWNDLQFSTYFNIYSYEKNEYSVIGVAIVNLSGLISLLAYLILKS